MKHLLTIFVLLLCTLTMFAQKEKVTGPKKKPQTTTVTAKPKQQVSQPKQQKQQAASKPKQQAAQQKTQQPKQTPKTQQKQPSVSSPSGYENGHGYVDLGLSVKWATCNVGASSPTDYGGYYAWGETRTKSNYSWSTYFDSVNGSDRNFNKYVKNKKTTLDLSDDAAHVNWGGSWRMPTIAEQDELREKCTWTWTTQNGVKGYKVVSKRNGNSFFLPAAGYRSNGDLYNAGSSGLYWSSSLYSSYSLNAYDLSFNSSNVYSYNYDRRYGQSVRAVCQ